MIFTANGKGGGTYENSKCGRFYVAWRGGHAVAYQCNHPKNGEADAAQTVQEPVWQTSWLSGYVQDSKFEKYALKTKTGELVALAACEILENDVMVHITYIESQPESNPTIAGRSQKCFGIGRVLTAYGVKLSIDHNCGGTVTFEAKFPNWPGIMSAISGLSPCQVLAVPQGLSFLARLQ